MFTIFNKLILKPGILFHRNALKWQTICFSEKVAIPLRPKKSKSKRKSISYCSDSKYVKVQAGKGGDGCISFLQLWCNERAGPDGGDGGNGGHIIFETCPNVTNFNHLTSVFKGNDGVNGANKKCHGKNADHTIIKLPLGTIVKNNQFKIVADLDKEHLMFVAAKGGAGGKGNQFFTSDTEQSPKVCEHGAFGENISYYLELRTIADVGLIGFPNAGKSTLLSAISRARPKVASYPFTTLKPNLGIIEYDDYTTVSVADLPGLIVDSHQNKGLGIQFLKHADRCLILVFVLDGTYEDPLLQYNSLMHELEMFSNNFAKRPSIIVLNKIDLPETRENIAELKKKLEDIPIIEISAKMGNNIKLLLDEIRLLVLEKNNLKNI